MIFEALSQYALLHLSRGAQRNSIDEDHVVGDLPLGELTRKEFD
jgi:hypothetical protein